MSQDISSRGAQQKDTWQGGVGAVQQQLNNAQDQSNGQTRFYGIANGGTLPAGATAFSSALWTDSTNFYLAQAGSDGTFTTPLTIPRDIATSSGRYLTLTTSALPPAVADLPADGNYGWHLDTSTSAYYWAYNAAGVIVYPNFLSISGTITGTQHSDLSAFVGTLHGMAQISGSISAAQHGNLSGTGPFHAFQGITGVITDTQHGARSGGTALHPIAVASGTAGFMSGTDKSKLDDITSAVSSSTVPINTSGYFLSNVAIISSRRQITNPAATAAGATYDQTQAQSVVDLVNELRTDLLGIGGLFHT